MKNSILLIILLLFFVNVLSAQTNIYWTDYTTDNIYKSDLDGFNQSTVTAAAACRGIAIDETNGYIYYVDNDNNKIIRKDLDGSNSIDIVTGLVIPTALALDVEGGKIYWSDNDPTKDHISRANLNGTSPEVVISAPSDNIYGIALDLVNNKIYWTQVSANKIQKADLNGSNAEDLITGLNNPYGIALDVANNYMYWTDYGTDEVRRATLSGGSSTALVSTGLIYPRSIAIDFQNSKLYWIDSSTDDIKSCALTGGTTTQVVTGIGNGNAIALYGVGFNAPTVTTTTASSITHDSASLGGNVTSDGGATVTERGVVYSTTDSTPTIGEGGVTKDTNGSGTGVFSESIGSLSSSATYYYNAYAINSEGTSYGTVKSFTTDAPLPVTLSNFSTQYVQNQFVKVNWTSESETNMYGYKLYR
ncbi:MAG: DUF5050 domain-containing protein, partial [Candidatus Cloacimonetes bacterium]|nr:DUF5050 domain-containing protein [Candidatus Cloacimonadota bacterium]